MHARTLFLVSFFFRKLVDIQMCRLMNAILCDRSTFAQNRLFGPVFVLVIHFLRVFSFRLKYSFVFDVWPEKKSQV